MDGHDVALIIIAFIGSVNVIGVAVLGYLTSQNGDRISHAVTKIKEVDGHVQEVHQLTNHLKDELVAEVRTSEFAKGVKHEADKSL